ncbi:MAG TPA: class III extradiol ring-cleavage dioxygenase [Candidatus Sulfotelmatobacter sp.]|nr:class III extradiol ring-cleavage dioxygenase [Candidatus Sulfotelmatobacter sp.]
MTTSTRQPAIFLSHAGGPCFWMTFPPPYGPGTFDRLRDYFGSLLGSLPAKPRAIVLISAHWEEEVTTVSTSPAPSMYFDYSGFPENTYALHYPAPGSSEVASEITELLATAGISHGTDATRGFDHGVFVPMLIADPKGEIPVVMVSIRRDLDPAGHFALGRALAPLREQNVLIVGSGNVWHGGGGEQGKAGSREFEAWVSDTLADADADRRERSLMAWESAPYARPAQPHEDHLMPLIVVAGAALNDAGKRSFHDVLGGLSLACYEFY